MTTKSSQIDQLNSLTKGLSLNKRPNDANADGIITAAMKEGNSLSFNGRPGDIWAFPNATGRFEFKGTAKKMGGPGQAPSDSVPFDPDHDLYWQDVSCSYDIDGVGTDMAYPFFRVTGCTINCKPRKNKDNSTYGEDYAEFGISLKVAHDLLKSMNKCNDSGANFAGMKVSKRDEGV